MSEELPGVSKTAVWVAGMRVAEGRRPDRLFDDPLASAFLAAAAGEGVGSVEDDLPTVDLRGADDLIAVRTASFDRQAAEACAAGVRQVVLVAAGLDTRAYRMDWPAGVTLFELDFPQVFAFKEPVIAASGLPTRCERVTVPVDLRADWTAPLAAAGFSATEPAVWLVEGLLPYLDGDDTTRLLGAIDTLSAQGSRVAFDHIEPVAADRPIVRTVSDVVRDLGAELWTTKESPGSWLAARDWRVRETPMPELAESYGRSLAFLLDPTATSAYLITLAAK
jgi:methyltransferase (TIGR00027 family)